MFENAIKILNILNNKGYESYIVGGYVRDKILNIESNDIDICTSATPSELQIIFPKLIMHEKYGAVKIEYNNCFFDITSFRIDEEDNNNLKIKYASDINIDVKRRDFTINSLYMDKDSNIIDLINAKQDFNNKIIRTIGNCDERIIEDPLRILRAIRYSIKLNFKLDNKLYNSIKKNKDLLKKISFTRKKEELDKIFSMKDLIKFFKLIDELNLSEVLSIYNYKNVVYCSNYLGIWSQIDYSSNYNFTKKESIVINNCKNILNEKINDFNTIYKYGIENCLIVAEILKINKKEIMSMYEKLPIHSIKDINITFEEIKEINNSLSNEEVGSLIKIIEEKILNNKLPNDNTILKEYIKEEGDFYE